MNFESTKVKRKGFLVFEKESSLSFNKPKIRREDEDRIKRERIQGKYEREREKKMENMSISNLKEIVEKGKVRTWRSSSVAVEFQKTQSERMRPILVVVVVVANKKIK